MLLASYQAHFINNSTPRTPFLNRPASIQLTKRMKRPFTIGLAVWTFFVLVGSLFPGNNLPHVTWLSLLHLDKFIHLSFYFVMCMLMYFSLMRELRQAWSQQQVLIASVCFSIGVGVLMEILQSNLNTGRYFDIFDILANTIGVFIAVLVINFKQLK